jgi:hypothetical protein
MRSESERKAPPPGSFISRDLFGNQLNSLTQYFQLFCLTQNKGKQEKAGNRRVTNIDFYTDLLSKYSTTS